MALCPCHATADATENHCMIQPPACVVYRYIYPCARALEAMAAPCNHHGSGCRGNCPVTCHCSGGATPLWDIQHRLLYSWRTNLILAGPASGRQRMHCGRTWSGLGYNKGRRAVAASNPTAGHLHTLKIYLLIRWERAGRERLALSNSRQSAGMGWSERQRDRYSSCRYSRQCTVTAYTGFSTKL